MVSGRPPPLTFLGANSVSLEKGFVEAPIFVSQSCLFFWIVGANSGGLEKGCLGFLEDFANFSLDLSPIFFSKKVLRKVPPAFFGEFISQFFLDMGKYPLILLYICLPIFSSKKVLWKVPRTFPQQC